MERRGPEPDAADAGDAGADGCDASAAGTDSGPADTDRPRSLRRSRRAAVNRPAGSRAAANRAARSRTAPNHPARSHAPTTQRLTATRIRAAAPGGRARSRRPAAHGTRRLATVDRRIAVRVGPRRRPAGAVRIGELAVRTPRGR